MNTKVTVSNWILSILLIVSLAIILIYKVAIKEDSTLIQLYQILQNKVFIDLTHAFELGIPHWPNSPDEKRETLYWYEVVVSFPKPKGGSGFPARLFAILP